MVLDGGSTPVGIESTVLSLVDEPVLLRPGMVDREELERLVGPVRSAVVAGGAHPARHAPQALQPEDTAVPWRGAARGARRGGAADG